MTATEVNYQIQRSPIGDQLNGSQWIKTPNGVIIQTPALSSQSVTVSYLRSICKKSRVPIIQEPVFLGEERKVVISIVCKN